MDTIIRVTLSVLAMCVIGEAILITILGVLFLNLKDEVSWHHRRITDLESKDSEVEKKP